MINLNYNMIKLTLTTSLVYIVLLSTSCSSNQNKTTLEYSGTVTFNKDSTFIRGLSRNGFIIYTLGDDKIVIESDNKGGVTYSFDGDDKQAKPKNNNQKIILKKATDNVLNSERNKVNDPK